MFEQAATVEPGAMAPDRDWPLVGRDAELEQATELLAGGQPAIGVVEGDLGIGKTRLLGAVASHWRARQREVHFGRATRFDRTVPLAMVIDAFGPVRTEPRSVRDELVRLAAADGVLLILDDVQWADQALLELLGSLVCNPPEAGVGLLLACRTGQLPPALCTAVEHAPADVHWMRLGPLPAGEVDRLLGPQPPERRRLLRRACGGNPLYLKILANAADDTLTGLAASPVRLDERVAAALDRTITTELRTLEEAQRSAMHAAAVLGEDVDLDLVAEVAGLDAAAAARAVDELVGTGVLANADGRLSFAHPLIRAAGYRLAGPGALVLTHQRAGESLRRRGAPPTRQAQHLEHAAQLGDAAAAEVLATAARTMLGRAPATSVRWLRVALRVLPQEPELAQRRSWLRVLMAKALAASGQLATCQDELGDLRGLTGDARASAVRLLAATTRLLGDVPTARALASTELDRALDPDTRTGLHLELLIDELLAGRSPHADRLAGGLGAAGSRRHPGLDAATATLRALSAVPGGCLTELIDRLRQAATLVDGLDDGTLCDVLDVLVPLGWVELLVDRTADTLRHVDRGLRLADRYGQRHVIAQLYPISALAHCRTGSVAASLRAADQAVAVASAVGSGEMVTFARMLRLRPVWLREGAVAAATAAAEVAAAPRLSSTWHQLVADAAAAEVLLALGRAQDCSARLQPWLTDDSTTVSALASGWCALLSQAHVAAGDLAVARRWLERAGAQVARAPLAGQLGAVAQAEAAVLLAENRADAAVARARVAVDHFRSGGLVVRAAETGMTLAEALRRVGQVAAARRELGSVRTVLADAGADWLADRAERARRRLGARLPRPAARSGLTAREREIAELVAQGMTNRGIAAALFLSPRTVDAHVGRILTKLGVPSRAAIARHLTD